LALIEVTDLSFRYPLTEKWALNSVSISVEKGEFVAIVGPTGAGKTTLCMCLNGLVPNNIRGDFRGTAKIAGLETNKSPVADLAHHVGIVFQSPESQLFGLTVEEEIAFGPENYNFQVQEISERIDWALDIVRMKEFSSKSPYDLSGGQKQRVAIAGALALRPEVLVMDEPLTELDPIGKSEVSATIRRLRDEHEITVVLVEHETEEVANYADRVLLMEQGRVTYQAPPREFFQRTKYLQSRGVDSPQVTQVASCLCDDGMWTGALPIRLEEAVETLKRLSEHGPVIHSVDSSSRFRDGVESVISFDDVTFLYPDGTEALRHINFEVKTGEFVAIIGQNGSGKTTLAKQLNGLLRPASGAVYINGIDTRKATVAELARTVGYLFQNPDHQIFSKTVEEEVTFGPKNLGMSTGEIESSVNEALLTAGIQALKVQHPLFLNKGQRQLVALASILSMKPQVLVLDEPTTGQDANGRRQIMSLVQRLHAAGKTIIVITHDMRLVAEYAPRAVVMWNGNIIGDGATRTVFCEPELLARTFIQPPQITRLSYQVPKLGVALSVEEMCAKVKQLHKT